MIIERMIELLNIEHECMQRKSRELCDSHCGVCNLVQDDGELHEMYTDVIAILKAHEPRVMTLETPTEWRDNVIWLEIRGKKPTPCLFRECSDRMMFGRYERLMYFDVVGSFRESGYMLKNYGVKWRCWNTKPSEDQRRATPWSR